MARQRRIVRQRDDLRNVGGRADCTTAVEQPVSHDDVENAFAVDADVVTVFGNELGCCRRQIAGQFGAGFDRGECGSQVGIGELSRSELGRWNAELV